MASVTDGTSNTHFVSEILQGAADDIRGTIWTDNPGAGSYMTRFTPNGYQDYVPLFQPWASASPPAALVDNNMDNLASFGGSGPGTSPPSPGSHVRQPARSEACVLQPGRRRERIYRFAEPASRRGQYPLRRRLSPLHEKLNQAR